MSTLTIELDDEATRLVEEAARAENKPLELWLRELVQREAERSLQRARLDDGDLDNGGALANGSARRVSPLHPGAMQPAADFNAPMEEFASYL